MPLVSFVCVIIAESFILIKLFQLVSTRCLLADAETQGGSSAMQARDKTLLGEDQALLAPLANKANRSKVPFLVSLFSTVELL